MVDLKKVKKDGGCCQDTINKVLSMQKYIQNLSRSLDKDGHLLCTVSALDEPSCGGNALMGFLPPTTQKCLDGLKESWKWMNDVMRCSSIHLCHAAECHMLHVETREVERCLEKDLERMLNVLEKVESDQEEELFKNIKEIDVALKQWATRIGSLKGRALQLHPIEKRVETLNGEEPAVVMVDYEDDEISLKENQDILLVDNSQSDRWKIRCGRGQETWLPSVIVRIPATSGAIDGVIDRGSLKLLAGWSAMLKKAGVLLIKCCLHHIQPHYQQHQISSLKRTNIDTKFSFVETLDTLNDTFSSQWDGHHLFISLQERISTLKMILEDLNEEGDGEEDEHHVEQQKIKLNNVSVLYQVLSKGWKGYKVKVESSRSPSLLLLPQQWRDYKEVSLDDVSSFWKVTMPLKDEDKQVQYKETIFEMGDFEYEDTVDFLFPSLHSSTISITPHRPVVRLASLDREVVVDVGGQENFIPTFKTASISSVHDEPPTFATKNSTSENESVFVSDSKIMIKNKPKFQTVNFNLDLSSLRSGESSSGGSYEEIRTVQTSKEALDNLFDHMGNYTTTTTTYSNNSNIQEFTTRSSSEASQPYEGASLGMATEIKTAETEQLTSAEMEEDRTYVIGGVLDKEKEKMISLKDAISKGIIIPKDGVYVDLISKQNIPISTAMSNGWIKVVRSTVRRSKEKFSSVGIITIRTVKECIRPFLVKKVKDGDGWVDAKEAEERGLLVDGWVVSGDSKLLISDAAEQGLVQLEYTDNNEAPRPHTEVKSYAVRAVVDTAARKTITFHEAVSKGIICKETGAYKDSSTGQVMYVEEAIMRGFLKGRLMGDVSSMNVDPTNQMVVMKKMRKKMSLRASKSAAEDNDDDL